LFYIRHPYLPAQQLRQERVTQGGECSGLMEVGAQLCQQWRYINVKGLRQPSGWEQTVERVEGLSRYGVENRAVSSLLEVGGGLPKSVFFRDEDRAMKPVFSRLSELGIEPEAHHTSANGSPGSTELQQRVIRRAQELRASWQTVSASLPVTREVATSTERPKRPETTWGSDVSGLDLFKI
jgi:hypothetical protein